MPPSKPSFRIILVRTEYEMNLGSAARLMANFGQSPLYLVKPDCMVGFTAKMYAKHAAGLLDKAVICNTLAEATRGCRMVVGTTGVLRRHRDALRHPLMVEEFREMVAGQKWKATDTIAILFGAEGNGLTEDEIKHCDALITIPTTSRYPVINLSHSIAVVLYALIGQQKKLRHRGEAADAAQAKALADTFDLLTDRYASNLRDPPKVKLAFRRVLGRAVPDRVEVAALMTVLRQAWRELEKKK